MKACSSASWKSGRGIANVAREPFLLDSSALLTLIEDEPGAERVEEALRHHATLIPSMALLEIRYVTHQERGLDEAERRFAILQQLPSRIIWELGEREVRRAATFKALHRISLADAIVAAHASLHGAVLLHKDPEFEALTGRIVQEKLPYRS